MKTLLAVLVALTLVGQQAFALEHGARLGRNLLQENRIGDGAGAVLDALGANQVGGAVAGVSDADDGDLTGDLAATGQDVGNLMLDTLPAAGETVPGRRKLMQPGGGGPGGAGPGGPGNGGGNNGGGSAGGGANGVTSIISAATGDVEGDVTQVGDEATQLVGDTVSNLGAGKRRLHQNAGTGAGCDAIFSDFDTSTGEGIENAEDNIAGDLGGHPAAGGATGRRRLHQNAGTGAGCDAIFSDFDTSTGEGIENAEDNIAGDIGGAKPAGRKLLRW